MRTILSSLCVVYLILFSFELNPINKYPIINKIDSKSCGESMKMIYLNTHEACVMSTIRTTQIESKKVRVESMWIEGVFAGP